jgi:hypothetical protein
VLFYIAFVICRYTLQPADGYRLLFHAAPPAGGLARAITGSAKDTGKYIRVPVHHVSLGVFRFSDKPDIFRYGCMGRTRILAVHYFVEVFGVFYISRFQRQRF